MYNIYNKRLLNSLKCDFKIYSNNDVNIISKMKGDYKDLQIPQAMSDASDGRRQFKIGSLYPALHALEKKGLLESRWGDDTPDNRGGARRRYYKLTGQGVTALDSIMEFRNRLLQWQPSF